MILFLKKGDILELLFSEATILSNMAIWVVLIYDYISRHILFCIVLYTQNRTIGN